MNKVVDIYLPLDSRKTANREGWPGAVRQTVELVKVIKKCGWKPNILNPDRPVASVAEGMRVIKRAKGQRFLNFMAGWAYPDFSVSPMAQLPADLPKLLLGSAIQDFPGNVGHYAAALDTFLNQGFFRPPYPKAIEVRVDERHRKKAKRIKGLLRGSIYGAVGPRSMQMWNKISEADFLRYFGIAREGVDGLRLAKMAGEGSAKRAGRALDFLIRQGLG